MRAVDKEMLCNVNKGNMIEKRVHFVAKRTVNIRGVSIANMTTHPSIA